MSTVRSRRCVFDWKFKKIGPNPKNEMVPLFLHCCSHFNLYDAFQKNQNCFPRKKSKTKLNRKLKDKQSRCQLCGVLLGSIKKESQGLIRWLCFWSLCQDWTRTENQKFQFTNWQRTKGDGDYGIYTQGNGEQVNAIMVEETDQSISRWEGFKIQQEVTRQQSKDLHVWLNKKPN